MEYIAPVLTIITIVLIPWVIQLIKSNTMSHQTAAWLSVGISLVVGLLTGLVSGIPNSPEMWVTFVFAIVGGVQVAYLSFKSVGITNSWLEALLGVGTSTKGGDKHD